jgi:ribosomal protein S18 acetylase RimI-like enzyme
MSINEEYEIVYTDKPAWEIIGGGISRYNKQQAGEDNARSLCFVIEAPDEEVVGGVIGATFWDWCHIDLMWIKEELRGHGYGQRLLSLAEDEARKRGAKHVYLDTYSFQAPEFYKKYGYRVFGVLEDYPAGHQLYFMTKEL